MSSTAKLPSVAQISEQPPFYLFLTGNEHLAHDPEFLTEWLRLGESDRRRAITDCVMHAAFSILMPVFLVILPLIIIETRRELRRIKEKRLLISEGQILEGEVLNCSGRRRVGPHEDSDSYYEVSVRFTFFSPEGVQLTGSAATERDDLQKAALPQPGTPVLVRYLNAKNYSLL